MATEPVLLYRQAPTVVEAIVASAVGLRLGLNVEELPAPLVPTIRPALERGVGLPIHLEPSVVTDVANGPMDLPLIAQARPERRPVVAAKVGLKKPPLSAVPVTTAGLQILVDGADLLTGVVPRRLPPAVPRGVEVAAHLLRFGADRATGQIGLLSATPQVLRLAVRVTVHHPAVQLRAMAVKVPLPIAVGLVPQAIVPLTAAEFVVVIPTDSLTGLRRSTALRSPTKQRLRGKVEVVVQLLQQAILPRSPIAVPVVGRAIAVQPGTPGRPIRTVRLRPVGEQIRPSPADGPIETPNVDARTSTILPRPAPADLLRPTDGAVPTVLRLVINAIQLTAGVEALAPTRQVRPVPLLAALPVRPVVGLTKEVGLELVGEEAAVAEVDPVAHRLPIVGGLDTATTPPQVRRQRQVEESRGARSSTL